MNYMKKHNGNRLIETENRLTAVKGKWGLGETGERLSRIKKTHGHRQQYGDYQRKSRGAGSKG